MPQNNILLRSGDMADYVKALFDNRRPPPVGEYHHTEIFRRIEANKRGKAGRTTVFEYDALVATAFADAPS